MNYQLTNKQYAAIYRCSERTVTRARREKAPLDTVERALLWFVSHKSMPPALVGRGLDRIEADYRATAGGGTGAPTPEETEALADLEEALTDLDVFASRERLKDVRAGLREELDGWHGRLLKTFGEYTEIMERHGLGGLFGRDADGEATFTPDAELEEA